MLHISSSKYFAVCEVTGCCLGNISLRCGHLCTDDTERFSGEAKATLPASVPAAAAGAPNPDDVLESKHYDHHKLLQNTHIQRIRLCNFTNNILYNIQYVLFTIC